MNRNIIAIYIIFGYNKNEGEIYYKVNRCLARYSPCATTTKQPNTRAPNEPAGPGKNANFRPNLDVFGQKILFFTGES